MNEVEVSEDEVQGFNPIVMVVSPYSNIANHLKYFASAIKDESEADMHYINIDCYSKEVNGSNLQVIRLSNDTGMWTELNPVDKVSGALLPESVSVNLFDLYNAVENCPDELLKFWIDEEDNELVFNSFQNPDKDIDELEIRFTILKRGFPTRALSTEPLDDQNKLGTITLNAIMTRMITEELNVENSIDGINIVVRDGKLRFQASYHGFNSDMRVKQFEDEVYPNDFSVFLPITVFIQMVSTGHVYDLKIDVYDNGIIILKTDAYQFYYKAELGRPDLKLSLADSTRYLIIDAKLIDGTMKLMNRLNKASQINNMMIEYVSDGEADLSCQLDGRWGISIRTDLAMLSKETVVIDADIFQEMVSGTQVDAIQMNIFSPNVVCMKLENGLIEKVMEYDHKVFSEYREQKYQEWKKKND